MSMSKDQINVGLFDRVKELERERDELRAEVERMKAQSGEQNRCMNQLRELWKHLPVIENKYDERLAHHVDELIERLKADKARMDWIEKHVPSLPVLSEEWGHLPGTFRDILDAAMKGDAWNSRSGN